MGKGKGREKGKGSQKGMGERGKGIREPRKWGV